MKKLLTKQEFEQIFVGIDTMTYADIRENILKNPLYSVESLEKRYIQLMPKSTFNADEFADSIWLSHRHVEKFYWNVRFFLNNAYRDNYLGYPFDGYVYAKILSLKTAFLYWSSFQNKVEQGIVNFKEEYPEYYVKYAGRLNNESETITWLGKTKTFRQFSNDIKHNLDFLTDIQVSFLGNIAFYAHDNYRMVQYGVSYNYEWISDFFFEECFSKLFVAFNDLVQIYDSHHSGGFHK